RENFLSIGRLRVAGKMLASPASAVGNIVSIAMPAEYVMVTRTGPVRGVLDGESVDGPRWLSAAEHRYELVDAGQPVALVWATAIERGFTPFPPGPSTSKGRPEHRGGRGVNRVGTGHGDRAAPRRRNPCSGWADAASTPVGRPAPRDRGHGW